MSLKSAGNYVPLVLEVVGVAVVVGVVVVVLEVAVVLVVVAVKNPLLQVHNNKKHHVVAIKQLKHEHNKHDVSWCSNHRMFKH